jgi:hypothetical protein
MGGKQGDPGDEGAGHRAQEDRQQEWDCLAQPPPHQSPRAVCLFVKRPIFLEIEPSPHRITL